jgi:membrane protein required for colicin V production
MNGLDWLIAVILLISVILAAMRGFMFELFSLAGTVAGYLLAAWNYRAVGRVLSPYLKNDLIAAGAAFLLIFLAVVVVAGICGRIARWATKSVGLSFLDRLLGAAFGLLRGSIVVMVLVMALASFMPGSGALAGSSLAASFLAIGRAAIYAGPGELRDRFREGLRGLQHPGQPPGKAKPPANEIL